MRLHESVDFWPAALESSAVQVGDETGPVEAVRIESTRTQSGGVTVIKLAGIEDRDAAQAVCGSDLWLKAGAGDVAPPESLRPFQVRGLRVVRRDGSAVGVVADLLPMPAQPVLLVRGAEREHLVPWVDAIVVGYDPDAGEIRIDPPDGLLELSS